MHSIFTLKNARTLLALAIAGLAAAAMYTLTIPAFADTLFGGAANQGPYSVLISNTQNANTADDYSGISYSVATGTTLASLGTLSARYNVVDTDCGGGSPRFQVNLTNGTTTGNMFVYVGPEPSYSGCAQNTWTESGNLLNGTRTVDTSQLPGGTFYDTWAHATSAYGSWTVTGVQLVADGGWATGGIQRIRLTNVNVGGTAYTYPQATTTAPATTTLMAPTPLSPVHGSTLTTAQWTAADWSDVMASATPVTYRYESSNSSSTNPEGSFSAPLYQSGALSTSQISTAGTGAGTYYWHARAVDANGAMSPWSSTVMVTVSNATSTPSNPNQALIDELKALQAQFPQNYWQLQWLIDDLSDDNGTTTPPTNPPAGSPSIDNNGSTIAPMGHLDFVGRNFGADEEVRLTLSGSTLRTLRADGGGNFSTGSMTGPTSPGTYTFVFTGLTSGRTANSTITVQ